MTYQEYVIDVFEEDQCAMGMDIEEVRDIVEETPFSKIEKWLTKKGYDLNEYNLID